MSKSKKIIRVVGTRPQLMQVKPLSNELEKAGFNEVRVHTGQHYSENMSGDQIKSLGLPEIHHNLKVGSSSHGEMFGRMIPRLEALYQDVKPDIVLADGDTNSTFAAIFAAQRIGIPTVHAEAGLRDFDRARPEELNRILSDHTADLNCAPVPRAMENLANENLTHRSILCGDLLLDNFLLTEGDEDSSVLDAIYHGPPPPYLAMTLHRPENTDLREYERFCDIMQMLSFAEIDIVFPVHPRTQPIMKRYDEEFGLPKNLKTIDPVPYPQMLALIKHSAGVVTDSGGLPREACWIGKRVLMLFRVDTWHDLMENNLAILGNGSGDILKSQFTRMMEDSQPNKDFARNLFGNGLGASKIAQNILDRF